MNETIFSWCLAILILSALKSMIIGSHFSFYLWAKYGWKYVTWYWKWLNEKFDPSK